MYNQVVKSCFYQEEFRKDHICFISLYTGDNNPAHITSQLDYYIGLSFAVSQDVVARFPLVQNVVAWFLLGTRKQESPPIASSFHRPLVVFKVKFKSYVLFFKFPNQLTTYLSKQLHPHAPTRSLRSTNQIVLTLSNTAG